MTSLALLLLATASIATAQNVLIGDNEVPIESLGVVPGAVIAKVPSSALDSEVDSHWLSLFPEMAPSQRLGVFLHLSDWSEEQRSKLDQVAKWLIESPSMLTQFLTPEEFSQNLAVFEDSLTESSLTIEDVVHEVAMLPDFALLAYMEKTLGNGTLAKFLDPATDGALAILGLTCAQLEAMPAPASNIFLYLGLYSDVTQTRIIPFSLLQCFKAKLADYLRAADTFFTEVTPETLLDRMSSDDLENIDSRVLSSFSTMNFTRMANRNLLNESISKIGLLPMKDIIVVMSREKFVSLSSLFDLETVDLFSMGSFMHATGEEVLKALPEELSSTVRHLWTDKTLATLCVPEMVREKWRMGLIKMFGAPELWSQNTLVTIGDLLINLNPSDWSQISAKNLRSVADKLISRTGYLQSYNQMPSYTNETIFFKVCQHWLGEEEGDMFGKAHFSMMRNLLLASELNSKLSPDKDVFLNREATFQDVAADTPADGQRRRRSAAFMPLPDSLLDNLAGESLSHDFTSFRFTRSKRQVETGDENKVVSYSITLISSYYQAAIKSFNERLAANEISEDESNAVNRNVQLYREGAAKIVQDALNLPELPILDFIPRFNAALEAQTVSQDDAREIRRNIVGKRLELMRGIVAALDLHPEDFPTELTVDHEQFCQYANTATFCAVSVPVTAKAETEADKEELPTIARCGGLQRAGKKVSQVALMKEDVARWSKEELKECLADLGSLELDLDLKLSIWRILYEKEVDFLASDHFKLRNLLEAALYNETDREQRVLKASHLEHLSLIGAFTYPEAILKDVVQNMVAQTGDDFPAEGDSSEAMLKNVLVFGSMGHLVCGFRDDVLTDLLQHDEVAATLLPIFAQLKACPNKEALTIMANKAINLYGDVSTWSPSLVRKMGLIVSGLPEPHMLPVKSFAAIGANAIAHFESSLFESLSDEHLSVFPVEALASIDVSHFKSLPGMFSVSMLSLEKDLPSGRLLEVMKVYQGNWREEEEAAKREYKEKMEKEAIGSASNVESSVFMLIVLLVVGGMVAR